MTFGDEKWAWVGGGEGKFSIYVMLTVVSNVQSWGHSLLK